MNYSALYKALRFAFLPTIIILSILLVGFCDIGRTWEFVKSTSGAAIFVRLVALILETVVICIMYSKYSEKDRIKKASNEEGLFNYEQISEYKNAKDLFRNYKTKYRYKACEFDKDTVIVKRFTIPEEPTRSFGQ